jgi:hypothetical protein
MGTKKVRVKDVPATDSRDREKKKDIFAYSGPRLPFYQMSAMTTKAFILCLQGILIDDLVKWVKAQGGEPRRVVRIMRSGRFNGKSWKVHEEKGFLKIDYAG